MFYLYLSLFLIICFGAYFITKYLCKFDKMRYDAVILRILKVLAIVYFIFNLITIVLPDALLLNYSQEELLALNGSTKGIIIVRWLGSIAVSILPLSVFFKNRTIRNIAIYFCTIITVISIIHYPTFINYFTSTNGRGLNSISIFSDSFKNFMLNPVFRSFVVGFIWSLELIIPIILAIQEKHIFDFKNKKEYFYFVICLISVIIASVPVYAMQHLFGYTDIIFEAWSIPHIIWIFLVLVILLVLYFIYKNKDDDTKRLLLLFISLNGLLQYNQMFGAVSIDMARMPFQLCNIGSYLIVLTLITKSKKLFDFTVIVNVIGVLFALAMPDLAEEGLFYYYNMHLILEHTSVILVPVLALMFGLFPRLDKNSLKNCLIGFTIYFFSVFILGTIFNGIATFTNNDFYLANYFFMFDKEVAVEVLPFMSGVFDMNFNIGIFKFYPVVMVIIFAVFISLCILMYYFIKLIYFLNDKSKTKIKKV